MPTGLRTLSKSDFKTARDCPAKLFYKESGYATVDDSNPYLQLLAQGGYMIEQLAKAKYHGGREMGDWNDPAQAWAATETAIRGGDCTLFEATLLQGRRMARVDILERRGNTLRLIEVKAKSWDSAADRERADEGKPSLFRKGKGGLQIVSEWQKYLDDVTYQTLLLESLFPEFTVKPYLCLVDKAATCVTDTLPEHFEIVRDTLDDGSTRLRKVTLNDDGSIAARESLTIEIPVHEEVNLLRDDVAQATATYLASYEPTLHRLPAPIGTSCRGCEYRLSRNAISAGEASGFAECWGSAADASVHLLDLYNVGKLPRVDDLIANGTVELADVPVDIVSDLQSTGKPVATRQARQIEHTRSQQEYVGSALAPALEAASYPLYFLDFEAARTAVPFHAGMKPYGLLAFQWSCHIIDAPGAPLRHLEFIHQDRTWPNEAFARSLAAAIGNTGTVLSWSPFESSIIRNVRDELSERGLVDDTLAPLFELVSDAQTSGPRVLDMHRLAEREYFHPGMGGKTSIKVVLDSIWKSDADVRARFLEVTGKAGDPLTGPYAALEPLVIAGVEQHVAEGTGAIKAYEALTFGVERNDPAVQDAWRRLLLEYCKLDTLAMVLIWEYWGRRVGQS